MKKILVLIYLWVLAMLTSCVANYYQLLTVKPVGDIQKKEGALVFEDANCKISYYFWSVKGTTCIRFENKTNEDIYLDLAATFYFMNNHAFDLYTGATTSNSVTTSRDGSIYWGYGITTGRGEITNSTVVMQEQRMVTIPAKMYKIIGETDVHILKSVHRDCGLNLAPSKKEVNSLIFTESDSPYTFGLRLSYYVGNSNDAIRVKNTFYIDQITNYPQSMFKKTVIDDSYGCPGERTPVKYTDEYFFQSPDAFYIEYIPAMVDGYESSRRGRVH